MDFSSAEASGEDITGFSPWSFIFTFLIVIFYFSLLIFNFAYATSPHFELSPSSGTINPSGTNIQVKIDSGGQQIKSAKVIINFDASKIEISSVEAGTFFDTITQNIYNSTGQVVINASFSSGSSVTSKTGIGNLATMVVRAKTTSGTSNITFDCTLGSTIDSAINNINSVDVIDCASNINGSYTLGQGVGRVVSSPTATPSALPKTGVLGPTIILLFLGAILLLISLPLFLFV